MIVKAVAGTQPVRWHWLSVAAIVAFALAFHLWGIRQDLPYTPEVDETSRTGPAVRMAATGDLNPRWFGHPGSTVIYPMAMLHHTWYALSYGGHWLRPNPEVQALFATTPSTFFLLGRMLAVAYAVLSIPLVYLVGRRAFGLPIALVGAWLAWLAPTTLENAQMVRTDSAGAFFGLLGLLMCLRLYEQPTRRNQVLAGLVIGLAVATRYFMVVLVPVLVAVDAIIVWRSTARREALQRHGLNMVLGLLMVPLAFAVVTPYFFLDYRSAWQSLKHEARSENLGADGLSPLGNLLWYVTSAIPANITWPRYLLALVGIGLAVRRRRPEQLLLLVFVTIFLATISVSSLHWERWVIQILPVLALFTAAALSALVTRLWPVSGRQPYLRAAALVALAIGISAPSVYQVGQDTYRRSSYSTRIAAREWIVSHVPRGSRIALEWYTAPLTLANFERYAWQRSTGPGEGNGFTLFEHRTLATRTLEEYRREGFEYLVVSDEMYGRYLAEAEKYPSEAAFYHSLFEQGELIQQFSPVAGRRGPTISVYRLSATRRQAHRA